MDEIRYHVLDETLSEISELHVLVETHSEISELPVQFRVNCLIIKIILCIDPLLKYVLTIKSKY